MPLPLEIAAMRPESFLAGCCVAGTSAIRFGLGNGMSTVRRPIAPALVGAVAFVADLRLFFFVWAEADAIPTAHPAFWPRIAWPIISFPVFSVTSKDFATVYFWELGFVNISLWACTAAFIAWRLERRKVA
jgi:hypothetical protein